MLPLAFPVYPTQAQISTLIPHASVSTLTKKRRYRRSDEKSLTKIISTYKTVLSGVNDGLSLNEALACAGLRYGTSPWLSYRWIAELSIVDNPSLMSIWNPVERLRTLGRRCRNALKEKQKEVSLAKATGKILK